MKKTQSEKNTNAMFPKEKVCENTLRTCEEKPMEIMNDVLLHQIAASDYYVEDEAINEGMQNAQNSLESFSPNDTIESMLMAQMIATHNAAMFSFLKAKDVSPSIRVDNYLNSATKLTRTFTMQMEALNCYREKGQQKMTVEHVHIHPGGQAIAGTINSTKDLQGSEVKGAEEKN